MRQRWIRYIAVLMFTKIIETSSQKRTLGAKFYPKGGKGKRSKLTKRLFRNDGFYIPGYIR